MKNIFALTLLILTTKSFAANYPPPPPYQSPPPIYVGSYSSTPDFKCLAAAPKADPLTIDNYIANCEPSQSGPAFCDRQEFVQFMEDDNCYQGLMAKETMPNNIHWDQMNRLHAACQTITYDCYMTH